MLSREEKQELVAQAVALLDRLCRDFNSLDANAENDTTLSDSFFNLAQSLLSLGTLESCTRGIHAADQAFSLYSVESGGGMDAFESLLVKGRLLNVVASEDPANAKSALDAAWVALESARHLLTSVESSQQIPQAPHIDLSLLSCQLGVSTMISTLPSSATLDSYSTVHHSFSEVIKMDPSCVEAHSDLGDFCLLFFELMPKDHPDRAKVLKESLEAYTAAFDIQPDVEIAKSLGEVCMAGELWSQAYTWFIAARSRDPSIDISTNLSLAESRMSMSNSNSSSK